MKKSTAAAGALCVFSAGYFLGAVNQSKFIINRLKKAQPMVSAIFVDLVHKVHEGEMSHDELIEYTKTQMNFANIIMKEDFDATSA